MIIAVDFDGTVVNPITGEDLLHCVNILSKFVENGHQLILLTMRSGVRLREAVQWFVDRKIHLWGVNANPEQHAWTDSAKVHADLYIDDCCLGCPLKDGNVDWVLANEYFKNREDLVYEFFSSYYSKSRQRKSFS